MRKYLVALIGLLFFLGGCTRNNRYGSVPAPTALPDRIFTVVALGDSLTEGERDTPGLAGYPGRLQRMLDARGPGSQVVNLGRSGWTSEQLIQGQLPAAVEIKPSSALVWIGSNDLWQFYRAEQEEQDLRNFTANINTILRTLKGTGARVYIALLDDQSKRPVAHTSDIVAYTDADRKRMSRRAVAYNGVIEAKATEYGASTEDVQ